MAPDRRPVLPPHLDPARPPPPPLGREELDRYDAALAPHRFDRPRRVWPWEPTQQR